MNRRLFLRKSAALAGALLAGPACGVAAVVSRERKTDVRIEDVTFRFTDFVYRAPVKFAGAIMDRATLLTVRCRVVTREGRTAEGAGYMPFNHIFSYPSRTLTQEAKNNAMKALAVRLARVTSRHQDHGHPLELNDQLAPEYLKAAAEVSRELRLADAIPKLCTLVTSSAFDAAIHDAYGKAHGVSVFATYRAEFMGSDLSRYLGVDFAGRYPGDFLLPAPKPKMPLCHMISAVDPVEAFQNPKPLRDGWPETLPEWIAYNGLIEFKIKVNGDNLDWDVERVVHIDRVVTEAQAKRGVGEWFYVLDFNEKCPSLDYFNAFLRSLREKMPRGYGRIRYVEQPTSRDLNARPELRLHDAAKLCPVVIDESLVDVPSLLRARELGWTGAVVKSPKGLSNMLLVTAVAGREKIYLAGGDMSCPGAALVQTANFQARVPTISSIEANVRQFFPEGNKGWETRFPGLFRTSDGLLTTGELTGPGLGV